MSCRAERRMVGVAGSLPRNVRPSSVGALAECVKTMTGISTSVTERTSGRQRSLIEFFRGRDDVSGIDADCVAVSAVLRIRHCMRIWSWNIARRRHVSGRRSAAGQPTNFGVHALPIAFVTHCSDWAGMRRTCRRLRGSELPRVAVGKRVGVVGARLLLDQHLEHRLGLEIASPRRELSRRRQRQAVRGL